MLDFIVMQMSRVNREKLQCSVPKVLWENAQPPSFFILLFSLSSSTPIQRKFLSLKNERTNHKQLNAYEITFQVQYDKENHPQGTK